MLHPQVVIKDPQGLDVMHSETLLHPPASLTIHSKMQKTISAALRVVIVTLQQFMGLIYKTVQMVLTESVRTYNRLIYETGRTHTCTL